MSSRDTTKKTIVFKKTGRAEPTNNHEEFYMDDTTSHECRVAEHVPIPDGSACSCGYFQHTETDVMLALERAYEHGNGLDFYQVAELLGKDKT